MARWKRKKVHFLGCGSSRKCFLVEVRWFFFFTGSFEIVFKHAQNCIRNCLVSSADEKKHKLCKDTFSGSYTYIANTSIIPGRTSSGSMVRSDALDAFVRSKPGVDGNWSLSGKGLKVWCQPWWIKHEPWGKKKTGSLTFQLNPGGLISSFHWFMK